MTRKIPKRLPKTDPQSIDRARSLRRKMTDAERLIWARLRANRIKFKFRRQEPIGNYIVDFVCIEKGLIVELDGGQHYSDIGRRRDKRRDEYLKSLGFKVLRFSDKDVMKDAEGVMSVIWEVLNEDRNAPPFGSPPETGGE